MKYILLLFLTGCSCSIGINSKPSPKPLNLAEEKVYPKCKKIKKPCQEYMDDFDNVAIFSNKDGSMCWMKQLKKGSYCYD